MRTYLAAEGWNHDPWQGDFYPDDLPIDWRLSYYFNEFRAVAVPAGEWLDAPADQLAGWLADTGPHFRFFLLLDESHIERAGTCLPAIVDTLGEQCGGLVIFMQRASQGFVESLSSLVPAGLRLAIICHREPEAVLHASLPENMSLNWVDAQGLPSSAGKGLCAVIVPEAADPKRLRALIEGRPGERCEERLLLFGGTPPNLETLRAADVILGLLGLA